MRPGDLSLSSWFENKPLLLGCLGGRIQKAEHTDWWTSQLLNATYRSQSQSQSREISMSFLWMTDINIGNNPVPYIWGPNIANFSVWLLAVLGGGGSGGGGGICISVVTGGCDYWLVTPHLESLVECDPSVESVRQSDTQHTTVLCFAPVSTLLYGSSQ